jgi:hypothetical protein
VCADLAEVVAELLGVLCLYGRYIFGEQTYIPKTGSEIKAQALNWDSEINYRKCLKSEAGGFFENWLKISICASPLGGQFLVTLISYIAFCAKLPVSDH